MIPEASCYTSLAAMTPRALLRAATALLAAVALVSCSGGSQTGPCNFVYEDAILHVRAATDSVSGAAIPRVRISDVRLNGAPVTRPEAVLTSLARGATVENGMIVCTVACEFGMDVGTYTFTASAPGYRSATVAVDGRYATNDLGCPGRAAGGRQVDIVLAPSS